MNSSILRVLFVGHTYIVGINQQKFDALARTGQVEVGLLVPDRWQEKEWDRTQLLEKPYADLKVYPCRVWFGGRGGAYLYPPRAIRKAISDFKPDLIQVEQEVFSMSAFQLAIAARIWHKPLVVFCWENMDKQLSIFRRWSRRFVLNTAAMILAGNNGAANLIRQWGYTGTIEVIPQLGVDKEMSHPFPRKENGIFSIGYIGRLVQQKGIDLIFIAAKQLCKDGLQLRLILCGTGPDEKDLRKLASETDIENIITWCGAVKHVDVPEEMAKMDVVVLPSRTLPGKWVEQFGHVLIEAMAMGIPVVGSSNGAIPDVIGRKDLIFQENNSMELIGILRKLITDEPWRQEVSQFGLSRINEFFSHEAIANRLICLWEQIPSKKG